VPDSHIVPTDMGDGPAIAVLDPVGGGRSFARVMITSPMLPSFPSARALPVRPGSGSGDGRGSVGEVGDKAPGWGVWRSPGSTPAPMPE
jgi:hypothetical protein